MANNVLRAKLEARIVDLEYQVKHGKLDPKIALTALMEETVAECADVLDSFETHGGLERSMIIEAISLITIKD